MQKKDLINTSWEFTGDIGFHHIDGLAITLLDEGFFQFIKILDGKQDKTYGETPVGGHNSRYTWDIDGNSINLSFRDYTFLKGKMDFKNRKMEGKKINKYDEEGDKWVAEEMDLNKFMSDSNTKDKKELKETKSISAEEIIQAMWNTYGQPYDKDTPKLSILNYKYETEVKHIEADYISNDGLGCERLKEIDVNADDYNPEETETIEISIWDYIIDNFESDFNSEINASKLVEELDLGLQGKEDIEEILNNMMDDLCEIFRGFTVIGGEVLYPEQGDNPWEHPETIYLEVLCPEILLENLNPDWTEDKDVLT